MQITNHIRSQLVRYINTEPTALVARETKIPRTSLVAFIHGRRPLQMSHLLKVCRRYGLRLDVRLVPAEPRGAAGKRRKRS